MADIQVVRINSDGTSTVLSGDPECDRDPCTKHGCCHCMCPCGCFDPGDEGYDDCDDCKESFGDD